MAKDKVKEALVQLIRGLREEKRRKRFRLENDLGLDHGVMTRLEHMSIRLSYDQFEKLVEKLGLSVEKKGRHSGFLKPFSLRTELRSIHLRSVAVVALIIGASTHKALGMSFPGATFVLISLN